MRDDEERYLAMDDGGDGEVPRRVGCHDESQERPDPVVVEGGDEHGGGAARAEDVGPRPLVQLVVDVVDVAAHARMDIDRTRLAIVISMCPHATAAEYEPRARDELDDGSEEQEGAVECQADVPPVPPQQPVQHLEPLH
jgi:hypothetical protein